MLASDLPLATDRARQGSRHLRRRRRSRAAARPPTASRAFDVVMAETIPMKGAVLTQISAWWFNQLEAVVPHHMISADADTIIGEVPALKDHRASLEGRAMLVQAHQSVSDRMRDPRLSLGLGLEGICRAAARSRARSCRPACSKAANSSLRSSARPPRPKPVTTKTSRLRGCARSSARKRRIRWSA